MNWILKFKRMNWRGTWLLGYLFLCCSLLPLKTWFAKGSANSPAPPRRLVIVVDGVPYQTIADLRAEGRFRYFLKPSRMISTFPSLTNPAMIEILHEADSQGYEDHYYDRERNRLLGSVEDRLRGERFIHGTFRETFDYHAPALKGALAYVAAPVGAMFVAQMDLGAFRDAFRKSAGKEVFVAYIGETDSLAHLGGEAALKSFLRTLDRAVNELIDESGGALEVEMLSDHGNRFDEYKHVKLNDAIESAGFVVEKSISSDKGVVLPKYGLVGASMLFTKDLNRARLAEVCAATAGVDLAFYMPDENTIEILSRRGRAKAIRQAGQYKYQDLGGDPLDLNGIVAALQARNAMSDDGFASSADWWRGSQNHRYADPLRRLFDGFEKYVKNRADVIVSYEDGYLIGSPMLTMFAHMRATHGSLLAGETEGFAMSTHRPLDPAIRGFELNEAFALSQRSKAGVFLSGDGHCGVGPALAQRLAGR
jgi:hypothetical protein